MLSSADLHIRQLTPDDLALMDGLLTMFGEAFDEVGTHSRHRPSAAYLRSLLASDYFIALTASRGSEVVGGIAAYQLKKFEQRAARFTFTIWRSRQRTVDRALPRRCSRNSEDRGRPRCLRDLRAGRYRR